MAQATGTLNEVMLEAQKYQPIGRISVKIDQDIDKFNDSQFNLVLQDKDGFLICKHIKSESKNTIAIMLTGKATQADKIKGSLAGCNDYLIKPVGRLTFQNAVKNFIPLKTTSTAIEA